LDSVRPSAGQGFVGRNRMSFNHSVAVADPRHATTTSRLPRAATPSSVATATYPIQVGFFFSQA
jgi:hypothetical protein